MRRIELDIINIDEIMMIIFKEITMMIIMINKIKRLNVNFK